VNRDDSFFANLAANMPCGVFVVDREKNIRYWSPAAEAITGVRADEAVGADLWRDVLKLVDNEGAALPAEDCLVTATLGDEKTRFFECQLTNDDGMRVPVALQLRPFRGANGDIEGVVGILSENAALASARRRIEELEALSLIDPLVKLGNRLYVEMNILARLNELRRYGWPFGFVFMDVDHFKLINDKFGHETGDKMLVTVAQALQSQARPFDVIGRWGGDEFCVLVVHAGREQLRPIAERYRTVIEQSSFQKGSEVVRGTVSLGATLAMPDDSVDTLYRRADQLMYQSKAAGRNRLTVDLGKEPDKTD